MPFYEYKCETCGEQFDFFARRISERPARCPECGGESLTKRLSCFSARVGSGSASSAASCPTGTCCPGGSCPLN